MNLETSPSPRPFIPPIVAIVLTRAALQRSAGGISNEEFEAKLQRLSREELQPRGFSLLVRDLADGHTRFLIKGRRGEVCDDRVQWRVP